MKTNRCQRLTYKLMADNRDLTICKDRGGRWSDWINLGDCKGTQKVDGVAGFQCGEGYQVRGRYCTRTLGGNFCKINGVDYKGKVMRHSFDCFSDECPG